MILDSLKNAGRGGFEWRDETIMEAIAQNKKMAWTCRLTRLGVYAVITGGVACAFYFVLGLPWAIAAGVVMLAHHIVSHAIAYIGVVSAGIALIVVVVIARGMGEGWGNINPMTPIIAVAGIAGCSALIRRETLGIAAIVIGASTLAGFRGVLVGIAVAIVGGVVLAYRYTRDVRYTMRMKDGAPLPHAPIGYQRQAEAMLARSLRRKNDDISARHLGSLTEVDTARKLSGVRKAYLFHDVSLPGADAANIDHVVVTARAIFIVDSKRYRGSVSIEGDQVIQITGNKHRPLASVVQQMGWARRAVTERATGTDLPVHVVVAVHGASVSTFDVLDPKTGTGVTFLPIGQLVSYIERTEADSDGAPTKQKSTAKYLGTTLGWGAPVYSGLGRLPLTRKKRGRYYA